MIKSIFFLQKVPSAEKRGRPFGQYKNLPWASHKGYPRGVLKKSNKCCDQVPMKFCGVPNPKCFSGVLGTPPPGGILPGASQPLARQMRTTFLPESL